MFSAVCGSENSDMGDYCFFCEKPLGKASFAIGGSASGNACGIPDRVDSTE